MNPGIMNALLAILCGLLFVFLLALDEIRRNIERIADVIEKRAGR